jgi:hypothetical protein
MEVSVPEQFQIPHITLDVVSAEFRDYITADGMFLPKDAYPPSNEASDDEEDDQVVNDAAMEAFVAEGLAKWGEVTVKVDDLVSPSDAAWMMPFGSGRCTTLGHVYMALKASNRIQEHFHAVSESPMSLSLQQWIPSGSPLEFRCYTRGARLGFAGQRYPINSLQIDVDEMGDRLDFLWTKHNLGQYVQGFWEVDLWLLSDEKDCQFYILGVKCPVQEEVERTGVFGWEELQEAFLEENSGTVVRALTGTNEMAATPNHGVPEEQLADLEAMQNFFKSN